MLLTVVKLLANRVGLNRRNSSKPSAFIGLTGTRATLKLAADSFKTLLSKAPAKATKDY